MHRGGFGMGRYRETYERWRRDPQGFWAQAAEEIDWLRPWSKVLVEERGLARWFDGAECNTCWNCLDRHVVAGHGERVALIYDSAILGEVRKYTYAQLTEEVASFAGVLAAHGAGRGDRVVIYMPMVPEAAIAMIGPASVRFIRSFSGASRPGSLRRASRMQSRSSSSRPPAGSNRAASSPTSRFSTRRLK